jgi:hypothetical protein
LRWQEVAFPKPDNNEAKIMNLPRVACNNAAKYFNPEDLIIKVLSYLAIIIGIHDTCKHATPVVFNLI